MWNGSRTGWCWLAERRTVCTGWATVLAAVALCAGLPPASAAGALEPDNLGDSGLAPDIGKFGLSAAPKGNLRTLSAGTWLNRGDLPEGEYAAWIVNSKANQGEPTYGGDYLVKDFGHDGRPDTWDTYKWDGSAWAPASFGGFRRVAYTDGRLYWQLDLTVGSSTPQNPYYVTVRALTRHFIDATNGYTDRSPDSSFPNLRISLEDNSGYDPLQGCTYDGGCVGGANESNPNGPARNDPFGSVPYGRTCGSAKSAVAILTNKLNRAIAARRRARRAATRRRLARSVGALKRQRGQAQSRARRLC